MHTIAHISLLAAVLLALSLARFVSSETDSFFAKRSQGIWNHRRGAKGYHDFGDAYTNARFTFYDAGKTRAVRGIRIAITYVLRLPIHNRN